MAETRSLLPLSVPAQAMVTGSGSALLLGVTAASLFLFATDVATREPDSATGRQLRITVIHPRPAVPAAPKPAVLVRDPAQAPARTPAEIIQAPLVQEPAAPPRATIVQATARSMADRSARGALVEDADSRPAPVPFRPAPPAPRLADVPRPILRPGRPTDALAEARREWEARQPRDDDRVYEDEADYDPRDGPPPPRARRNAQDYGRGYDPAPQARYADPYVEDDRYSDPDPYRRRR